MDRLAEDAPDLLKDGDGLGDVLDGHSQHDSVKRVGLKGQLGVVFTLWTTYSSRSDCPPSLPH